MPPREPSPPAGTAKASAARRLRGPLLFLAAMLLFGAAGDALLGRLALAGGCFRGRPMPPYAARLTAEQRERVERRFEELDGQGTPGEQTWDRELGWVNTPSAFDREGDDGFNSIGARGRREYAPRPPRGVLRVSAYGDSFTYCAQVGWADSFEALLEAERPDWELINLGVNGYGTDQALLRFQRMAPELGAHVVCIGLMLENIARNVNRYKPLLHPTNALPLAKPRFLLDGDRLELLPIPFATEREQLRAVADGSAARALRPHEYWVDPDWPDWVWKSSLLRFGVAWRQRGWRETSTIWSRTTDEPYRVTLAVLREFHRAALESGAQDAVVLIWPQEVDLKARLHVGGKYWQPLLDDLARSSVPFIDLSDRLAATVRAGATTGSLYSGIHLSRAGNQCVASDLRAWLEARFPNGPAATSGEPRER